MVIKKSVTEDEVILQFLKGELKSQRFSCKLLSILKELNVSVDIIEKGNIKDSSENETRKNILKIFRGYPDSDLFTNFPSNIEWKYVEFNSKEDIDSIFYIDYDYWNELSSNTSKPVEAAQSIKKGIEIFDVSNKPFWDGLEYLKNNKFDPIILLTYNGKKQLIIEGHSRMTIYALNPNRFINTYGYVGFCSYEEMKKYDSRMVD